MNKLTVTLKQHTPLIHFQHDQEGATLRASEVKPKLDKFILTKLGGKEGYQKGFEIAKNNGWIINNGKNDCKALDYKMRINIDKSSIRTDYLLASYIKDTNITKLERQGIKAISNTPFFAQEKQNGEIVKACQNHNEIRKWNEIEKKGIFENGNIYIKIITEDEELSLSISNYIQSFFICTNFGTRQSKGFGCFLPTKIMNDNREIALIDNEELLKQEFFFVYKKTLQSSEIGQILHTVNEDYKLLKSGRNYPYARSKLLLYVEHLNSRIGWEKKFIKVKTKGVYETEEEIVYELKCRPFNRRRSYQSKPEYRYYRALLGLAEQFEFLLENPPQGDKRNKMIIKVKHEDIQRYKSPLLFKVIENDIYLVGNEVSNDMLDESFKFLVNIQGDEGYEDEPIDVKNPLIKTPEDFSLKEFMLFAMNNRNDNAVLNYEQLK
ncbi:MAG: hypothetical protein ACTTKO_07360 [Candidatus Limimorpha sp.]